MGLKRKVKNKVSAEFQSHSVNNSSIACPHFSSTSQEASDSVQTGIVTVREESIMWRRMRSSIYGTLQHVALSLDGRL